MQNKISKALFATGTVICLLGSVAQVQAHHSFAAEFDADKSGTLTGVVTEVRFSNPHARYRIEVTAKDGSKEIWEVQAGSVTSLRPQGWVQDSIKLGDTMTIDGQLGRDGAKKIYVRGVELADGTKFGSRATVAAKAAPAEDRNVVIADPNKNYGYGKKNPTAPFDITGPWRNSYKFHVTVDDLEPKPTPFTAEGKQMREGNSKYDDPALRCIALGLPRIFGNPYNMDIYDAGDHYLFLYVEHNSPRRIWMDGRTAPENAVPTANGYSVGHWEGNDLVIETNHLMQGWLDGSGLPMSGDGTRTVERYHYSADHLSVDRTMTIYDPLYSQPLTRVRGSARGENIDVTEQDSCDPASYYVDLLESNQLEKYLKP